MSKKLNCFYDLSIAPCSYDFFAFLISAELHRIRNHFDNLSLIFLPGPNHGYKEDIHRSFEQNDNFFKNVLLPGPLLLPSCNSVIWLDNRDEAQYLLRERKCVFPRGFSLEKPV